MTDTQMTDLAEVRGVPLVIEESDSVSITHTAVDPFAARAFARSLRLVSQDLDALRSEDFDQALNWSEHVVVGPETGEPLESFREQLKRL